MHISQTIAVSGLDASGIVLVQDQNGGTEMLYRPAASITVDTPDGLNFETNSPLSAMGSGTVEPGGLTSYTVVNEGTLPEFFFSGYRFTYDNNGNVTGGTITDIQEFNSTGNVEIADFKGLFNAASWMAAVQQFDTNHSVLNAMVAPYTFTFTGGDGNNSFGGAGSSATYTGGAGSDTFGYGPGYGPVIVTDFDQGNSGFSHTFDQGEGDQIDLNQVTTVHSLSDVLSLATTVDNNGNADPNGGNTLIDFGNGDTLTLEGVTPDQLTADDFLFAGGGAPSEPFTWIAGTGDFAVASNWNNSAVPGSSDQVAIDPTSAATITSSVDETVSSIGLNSNAILDVTGGTFTILDGTGSDSSSGVIEATSGGHLVTEGSINNNGGVIGAFGAGVVTIDGGTIDNTNGGNANAGLLKAIGSSAVMNIENGATVIGGAIIDTGTINITGSVTFGTSAFGGTNGAVAISDGTASSGTGVIYNTGTLTLANNFKLTGTNFTLDLQGSGTLALNGNTIVMNTVTGDTLDNDGNTISGTGQIGTGNGGADPLIINNNSGTIEALGGTLQISNGAAFTNSGLLEAANLATLKLTIGGITNTGITPLASSNAGGVLIDGTLEIANPNGKFQLGGHGSTAINGGTIEGDFSDSETFENVNNFVSGYGNIGVSTDKLTLQNDASGVINANVSGQTLSISTGANAVSNAGVIEATAGGILAINSTVNNSGAGSVFANGGTVKIGSNGAVNGAITVVGGGVAELVNSAAQNISFAGTGTLLLDASQAYTTGVVSGFGLGDAIDLKDLAYASNETLSWSQSTGTLTINGGSFTDTIHLAGTYTQGDFALTNSSGNAEVVFAPSLWGELKYPAIVQGEHLSGVNPQYNATGGIVGVTFGETLNYTTTETSYSVTENIEMMDPFFLPGRHAPQTLASFTMQVPNRNNFILPSISSSGTVQPEGIFVYKDNSGVGGANVIWEVIGTPDSNGDGGATIGSPVQIGTSSGTMYNLTEAFKASGTPSIASSFEVVWDQYNSSTGQYNLDIQFTPINPDGSFGTSTTITPVMTETGGATSVSATATTLPGFQIHAAGGGGTGTGNTASLAYVLALAETDTATNSNLNLTGTHQAIHFQGYNATGGTNVATGGTTNFSFVVEPNLSFYASGQRTKSSNRRFLRSIHCRVKPSSRFSSSRLRRTTTATMRLPGTRSSRMRAAISSAIRSSSPWTRLEVRAPRV